MNNKTASAKLLTAAAGALLAFIMLFSAAGVIPAGRTAHADALTKGKEIYSENFDAVANGSLPEGWTLSPTLKNGGKAYVEDGKLIIDASTVELGKVLLPDSLADLSDYVIEADVAFTSSRDESRWMSLVVRQQENDQQYYHMCVRRNTTLSNGVEFAERSASGWSVMVTGAADSALGLDNETHLAMYICGDTVHEYVNGDLVIATDAIAAIRSPYGKGVPGIQANFSVITVDNVKVSEVSSIPETDESVHNARYMSYNFPKFVNIISPSAVITKAAAGVDLAALAASETRPDNVILYLNDDGTKVVSPDGSVTFGTLPEVYEKVARKMLPVFYVRTDKAADALTEYLRSEKIVDGMVMSDRPELVASVRRTRKKLGGAIDFTGMDTSNITDDKLFEIISTVNSSSAKTALLPESIATRDNVEYLQFRLITVWVEESADVNGMLHNSIQSGANGIVTDTPSELREAYGFYKNYVTLLQRIPMVIGHRGLPSRAPENSIESAREAIAAGVDCIELDVRLSSDGEIFVYHDNDLSSLTTGSGTVNSHTAKELRSYKLLRSGGYGTFKKYPSVKIPTLEDFFVNFKDDDVLFFIEIKEDTVIADKVADLIREYGMEKRCCMITFISNQVLRFAKAYPGISGGQLMAAPAGKYYEDVIESVINTVAQENATFNASGIADARLIKGLMYRGITCWPWTYGAGNTSDAYLLGVGGITTDTCYCVQDVPVRIDIGERMAYTLNTTDPETSSFTFYPAVYSRMGKVDTTAKNDAGEPLHELQVVVIDGQDVVEITDGLTVRAKKDGTAHLMVRLGTSSAEGMDQYSPFGFSMFTQVITVTVDSQAEVDPGELPTPGKDNTISSAGRTEIIVICIVSILVIAALSVFLALRGKHKNKDDKDQGETQE